MPDNTAGILVLHQCVDTPHDVPHRPRSLPWEHYNSFCKEDHGQIDDYEIEAVSSDNDRLLGDVYVDLGIQPLRAMEKIYTKVFLK